MGHTLKWHLGEQHLVGLLLKEISALNAALAASSRAVFSVENWCCLLIDCGATREERGSVLHEAGYLAYCVCSLAMTDEPQYDVRLFLELRRLTPEPIETALTQKNGCLIQL